MNNLEALKAIRKEIGIRRECLKSIIEQRGRQPDVISVEELSAIHSLEGRISELDNIEGRLTYILTGS